MPRPITLSRLCRRIPDPADRIAYFQGHPVETDPQMLPDIDRERGTLAPVRRFHRPLCRGVVVGDWHTSEQGAVASAKAFLKRWDGRTRERGPSPMTRPQRLPDNVVRLR